jgi:hypothetical protein
MALQWFVVPSAGAIGVGQQHNHAVAESESFKRRLSDKSEQLGRVSDIQDPSRGTRLLVLWAQSVNDGWSGRKSGA